MYRGVADPRAEFVSTRHSFGEGRKKLICVSWQQLFYEKLILGPTTRQTKKTIVRRGSLQNMTCLMLVIDSELQSKTFEEF